MENRGLLFIPDISGFTRFVNETEIEHSRVIIQELLEVLINANQIGLEISEIEGDAILFYKYGPCPDVEALYKQVADMFCAFHRHILAYENRRFCKCEACNAVVHLTLKVITHYGEFTGYNVKQFNKLIGKDIIVAHQLLKNDIAQHEYWLVTNDLVKDGAPTGLPLWVSWNTSTRQTESGPVPFQYTHLGPLKTEIQPEPVPSVEISEKTKMITVSREYDASILALFHATGDFNYRSRWREGVKSIEVSDHFLPRLGMRCRCVLDDGEDVIYASNYTYHPDKIEFSETEERKNNTTCYSLEKIETRKTKLTIDYYIPKHTLGEVLFTWTRKKKLEAMLKKSLNNLEAVAKEIRIPEES